MTIHWVIVGTKEGLIGHRSPRTLHEKPESAIDETEKPQWPAVTQGRLEANCSIACA